MPVHDGARAGEMESYSTIRQNRAPIGLKGCVGHSSEDERERERERLETEHRIGIPPDISDQAQKGVRRSGSHQRAHEIQESEDETRTESLFN